MSGKFKSLKKALFPAKYLRREVDALTAKVVHQQQQITALQKEVRAFRHAIPADPAAFAKLMRPLLPHQARGYKKIRVGGARDGGYVMLDDFTNIAAAYSLGIGRDVSWDLAIAEKGIPVFQFDHTVEKPPQSHQLFRFHRQKIGPIHQPEKQTVSLDELLKQNGHTGQRLLLGMDIDGAEWDVLDQLDGEVLRHFPQIVCELHDFHRFIDPAWLARAERVIAKLTRHHRLIHVHGNNFVPPFWNGTAEFPEALEASFALASAYDLTPSDETFPTPLDIPNARDLPEIPLGTFRFE